MRLYVIPVNPCEFNISRRDQNAFQRRKPELVVLLYILEPMEEEICILSLPSKSYSEFKKPGRVAKNSLIKIILEI